jgi:ribosome biogenesis protein Nip4
MAFVGKLCLDLFAMAGFQVTLYGRFWVTPKAETLAMYGLHRIRHHWIERLLPVGVATTHAVLAYNNTKFSDKSP